MAFQVVARDRIVAEIEQVSARFPALSTEEVLHQVADSLGAPVESVREIAASLDHEGPAG